MHLDQLRRLLRRGMQSGAIQIGTTTWEWDISGNCTGNVVRELHARRDRVTKELSWDPGQDAASRLILHVRCRDCEECRRVRRNSWAARAAVEVFRSSRTWFGTFTLSPQAHFDLLLGTRSRLRKSAVEFGRLGPDEQFLERSVEVGREITLWLKRLRKETGSNFRYMLALESHISGLPHYHVLLHEQLGALPITKRQLQAQWKLGFTTFKVADERRHVRYVTKYIAKGNRARVRASIAYGNPNYSIGVSADPVTPQGIYDPFNPKGGVTGGTQSPLYSATLAETFR